MPLCCYKNVNFLKSLFFQLFHEKPPAVMPIYSKKNVNSAKTTLYYGPKKSKRFVCLFTILTKYYCSQDHILSKNVLSLKDKLISYSQILSKNVNFLKNTVILCLFIQIFHSKPSAGMPIFGQNVNTVKTTL